MEFPGEFSRLGLENQIHERKEGEAKVIHLDKE